MSDTVLETERLYLRRPQASDASAIVRLAGDYAIARSTLNIPHPYPEEAAHDYIARSQMGWEDASHYRFAITLKTSGELMGSIGLILQVRDNRAEAGYWIGTPYWGKGYMTEALKRMIQFGFEEVKLNRIQASFFTDNPASGRVMEKAGMRFEGTMRQYARKWDEYKDISYMAILHDDYEG